MSQADAERAEILGLITRHADRITALERRLERLCGLFAFLIALAAAYGAKSVTNELLLGWFWSTIAFAAAFMLTWTAITFVLRQ